MAGRARLVEAESTAVAAEGGLVVFRWFGATLPPTLSLPEQIAAAVGDRIIGGLIAPGARIVEQEVADEFETSRGPVREALRVLEREGLARIHPRRGARVTQLSPQEVCDLFEIRACLYQAAARRLAETRSPEAIRSLEDGIRELRRLAEDPAGGERYAQVGFRMSLACARAAGNPRLGDMITSLALQTYRYSRLGLASRARRRQSIATWAASLAAIRGGDCAAAMEVAARRILAGRDEVLRRLASEPIASSVPTARRPETPMRGTP